MNLQPTLLPEFNEETQSYSFQGERLDRVSDVLNVLSKEFKALWTVKEMYNFLLDKQEKIKTLLPEDYEHLLYEGKIQHKKISDRAKKEGSEIHDWIERYIKSKINKTEFVSIPPTSEHAQHAIAEFLSFCRNHEKIEWVASEMKLMHREKKIAGTLDALVYIDGTFTLLDFKSSNQISHDYYLQTAIYLWLLSENIAHKEISLYDIPSQRLILRLPKVIGSYEEYYVQTPWEDDVMTFMSALQIKRWLDKYGK